MRTVKRQADGIRKEVESNIGLTLTLRMQGPHHFQEDRGGGVAEGREDFSHRSTFKNCSKCSRSLPLSSEQNRRVLELWVKQEWGRGT